MVDNLKFVSDIRAIIGNSTKSFSEKDLTKSNEGSGN